jgi:hypothetical protein
MVELALVLPLLLFLFLAIFDFARVFASAVSVESAAREAADYGTLYRWHWSVANAPVTEAEMEHRACTAASNLPDYSEPSGTVDHATCDNPTFLMEMLYPGGTPVDCSAIPREADPCRVRVTMEFDFRPIVPIGLQFFDTRLGIPEEVTLTRQSTFAVSDFEVDIEPVPSP